jgi:hypothetical protein
MTLHLCRLYHCTPLELERQPLDVVLAHIACVEAEATYQKIERVRQEARARRRR